MEKLFFQRIIFALIFCFALQVQNSHAQNSFAKNFQPPNSLADLAEGLLDSVVNISTSQTLTTPTVRGPRPQVPEGSPFQDFFDEFFQQRDGNRNNRQRQRRARSLGSGFVIDESGIIITNNHVITKADEILVDFANGTQLEAKVVGKDPKLDIAVLQVEPQQPLVAVPFGDSDKVRIGDWALAIGNPFGQGSSVSLGIVSAINRDINAGPYDNFIQTDAAINRGNSGGPLFNMAGEVIGINTAIISPTGGSIGLGFSIPSNLAIGVIKQLREFGETRRGWLGVTIQEVTDDIAESIDLEKARGALVGSVIKDGPAQKSGIKAGDIIVRFDGQQIEKMRDLPRVVAETEVGKSVDVVIWRRGAEQTVKVEVGLLEDGEQRLELSQSDSSGNVSQSILLGISLEELNDSNRNEFSIDDETSGLLVVGVDENSEAALKNIREGDVIVELGQMALNVFADAQDRLNELIDEGRTKILLQVRKSNGRIEFITVSTEEFIQ